VRISIFLLAEHIGATLADVGGVGVAASRPAAAGRAAVPHPRLSDMAASPPQRLQIVIGNRRYSSWSLRGWLALRVAAAGRAEDGLFAEVYVPLAGAGAGPAAREEARQRLLEHSPTGLVPVLHDHQIGVSVYDSLAIAAHVSPPVSTDQGTQIRGGGGCCSCRLPNCTQRPTSGRPTQQPGQLAVVLLARCTLASRAFARTCR
jgi:hypothetical protein